SADLLQPRKSAKQIETTARFQRMAAYPRGKVGITLRLMVPYAERDATVNNLRWQAEPANESHGAVDCNTPGRVWLPPPRCSWSCCNSTLRTPVALAPGVDCSAVPTSAGLRPPVSCRPAISMAVLR